jgi:nicotinate-nucleotide adenylyltransferase
MIKTGIYGGSFNPIHNGHIALARQMLTSAELDEVWFVVSPQNPFKQTSTDLLDDAKRLELTRLALADDDRLIACDDEYRLPRPSYTWHTLQALSRAYPDRTFTLLIGADNWLAFDRWYHGADILSHYPVAIYPRRHSPIDATILPAGVQLLDAELYDISSSDIRQRVRSGLSIAGMVPENIREKVITYYSEAGLVPSAR